MDFRFIDGTITTPQGFTGAAICGGIKEGNTTKKDIMMVKCDTLCNAAAVYTKNLVKSDAILVTQEHLKTAKHRLLLLTVVTQILVTLMVIRKHQMFANFVHQHLILPKMMLLLHQQVLSVCHYHLNHLNRNFT